VLSAILVRVNKSLESNPVPYIVLVKAGKFVREGDFLPWLQLRLWGRVSLTLFLQQRVADRAGTEVLLNCGKCSNQFWEGN
jgi:hypothetical protein